MTVAHHVVVLSASYATSLTRSKLRRLAPVYHGESYLRILLVDDAAPARFASAVPWFLRCS